MAIARATALAGRLKRMMVKKKQKEYNKEDVANDDVEAHSEELVGEHSYEVRTVNI